MSSYRLLPSTNERFAEAMREIDDLPYIPRMLAANDMLLDLALSSGEIDIITSDIDLRKFTDQLVASQICFNNVAEHDAFVQDLAVKLGFVKISEDLSSHERLTKALESRPPSEQIRKPFIVASENLIAFRIPSYDTKNTGQEDNLGKILKWACTLLNIKHRNIRLIKDASLGNDITLPARIARMMDTTIASLTLPPSEQGERAEFKIGFKANLVELLATIKLARQYMGLVQKAKVPKGSTSLAVSLDDLKKSVNGRAGLHEHGVPLYLIAIVKEVFNTLTKPHVKIMPGGWIHSLRQTNKVTSNVGVLYKLGYEPKVATAQKTITVIKNAVREKPRNNEASNTAQSSRKGKAEEPVFETYVKDEKNEPAGIKHGEFRLGVKLLLPYIDPSSSLGLKNQISKDSLSIKDKTVLNFYAKNRMLVDTLNLAYATKISLGNKSAKSTPLGYRAVRGHAINSSVNCEFMDASGKTYKRYIDIPEHVRNFFSKLLNKKFVKESDNNIDMVIDEPIENEQNVPNDTEVMVIDPAESAPVITTHKRQASTSDNTSVSKSTKAPRKVSSRAKTE
nr:hypothetical protein [Erysiphe lesion-associated ormycovirus 2]